MSNPRLIDPGEAAAAAPALPDGWSWRIYRGVLVIEHNGIPAGWVCIAEGVPFTADLAARMVRALANDEGGT